MQLVRLLIFSDSFNLYFWGITAKYVASFAQRGQKMAAKAGEKRNKPTQNKRPEFGKTFGQHFIL